MEGTRAATADVDGVATAGSSGDAEGAGGDVAEGGVLEGGTGTEDVVQKAQSLMRRIVASRPSPDPCLLHSLASILEREESSFEASTANSLATSSRSSHTIGRLVNLIKEDDDVFELVSSKFLVDAGYKIRVRAAAARLLLACISCWMDCEQEELARIKLWVIEDVAGMSNGNLTFAAGGRSKNTASSATDGEMLRTYATGLLAVALRRSHIVEDVLITGMAGKLMHYLRIQALGDSGSPFMSGDESSNSTEKNVEGISELKDYQCELGEICGCRVETHVLARLHERYCVQCLENMGEHLEVLGPVLLEEAVDICIALVQRHSNDSSSLEDMTMLSDVLKLVCSLAAYRKFSSLFVDRGGVQVLLAAPRVPQTLTGISLCLFAVPSLQDYMDPVYIRPSAVLQEIDPVQRNAASLCGSAFLFRAILDKRPVVELTAFARTSEGRAALAEAGILRLLLFAFEQLLKVLSIGESSSRASSRDSPSEELLEVLLILLKLTRNLCAGGSTNQDTFLEIGGVGVMASMADVLVSSGSRKTQDLEGSDSSSGSSTLERITERFGSAPVSTQGRAEKGISASVACLQMMLQLLGNFARRGEACQAAVWEKFFPGTLLELAALRVAEVYGPLCMVLYTCCHGNSKRCEILCQGDGAALFALLAIATVDNNSDDASGNTASSVQQIEWFKLLVQHVCLGEPLFPLLFVNLGVPPLKREVDHSKVNTDELISVCRLCLESSTLTPPQAGLLYILCDVFSSEESTTYSIENELCAGQLPMPLQTMSFMVDVLRVAAQGAVEDGELTPVPTLTSASCTVRLLGLVLSLWRMLLAWDIKQVNRIEMTGVLLSQCFVDLLLSLLEALGPPETRGNGETVGKSLESGVPNEERKFPGKNPYLGYRRDIVAVIANLSHQNSLVQDRVRERGSLLLVLQQCVVETENPFLREWGLWAMRNLLEGNEKNQEEISQLEVKQSVNLPELQRMGINVEIDPNTRRPRLVNESASDLEM